MKLYVGIDLHSDNSYVVIIEDDKVIYQKRLKNDMDLIVQQLLPYREKIDGIVVEVRHEVAKRDCLHPWLKKCRRPPNSIDKIILCRWVS